MAKLTVKELAAFRAMHSTCELRGQPFTAKNPGVVDHDHSTGEIRGVLHRGCNAMLGIIENGRARYILTDVAGFSTFLRNLVEYIYRRRPDAHIYPTHRDAEAKRLLRNKRARASRAKRAA